MTHLYTLYTEDINRSRIESLLRSYFSGFTLSFATGYWQGDREDSLRIEIALPNVSQVPYDAAQAIAQANHQHSVLVNHTLVDSQIVTAFGSIKELNPYTEKAA